MSEPVGNADDEILTALLGRAPSAAYEVVVRDQATATPIVIRNAPLTHDGRPMPTRYWLVDRDLSKAVSRLEADGAVRAAEREIDPAGLAAAHERYAAERDASLAVEHAGPRPSGGVGGTRTGVKCLHAHLAYHLAGGDDPVGRWVVDRLAGAAPPKAVARAGRPR